MTRTLGDERRGGRSRSVLRFPLIGLLLREILQCLSGQGAKRNGCEARGTISDENLGHKKQGNQEIPRRWESFEGSRNTDTNFRGSKGRSTTNWTDRFRRLLVARRMGRCGVAFLKLLANCGHLIRDFCRVGSTPPAGACFGASTDTCINTKDICTGQSPAGSKSFRIRTTCSRAPVGTLSN